MKKSSGKKNRDDFFFIIPSFLPNKKSLPLYLLFHPNLISLIFYRFNPQLFQPLKIIFHCLELFRRVSLPIGNFTDYPERMLCAV